MVDKVVKQPALLKKWLPDLKIDGELQAGAAIVDVVAAQKHPEGRLPAKPTYWFFPTHMKWKYCL